MQIFEKFSVVGGLDRVLGRLTPIEFETIMAATTAMGLRRELGEDAKREPTI